MLQPVSRPPRPLQPQRHPRQPTPRPTRGTSPPKLKPLRRWPSPRLSVPPVTYWSIPGRLQRHQPPSTTPSTPGTSPPTRPTTSRPRVPPRHLWPSPAEAERPSSDLLVDSGTPAAAPASVDDSVDPWDEPADTTDHQPAESAASAPVAEPQPEAERPSSDLLVDSGTVGGDEVSEAAQEAPASDAVTTASPQAEQTEPKPAAEPKAAPTGFTGDAALLDEPDPWD